MQQESNPAQVVLADENGDLSTTLSSSFGDNLGNHTATQNVLLVVTGFQMMEIMRIQISDAGDVGIELLQRSYKLYIDGKIKLQVSLSFRILGIRKTSIP